MGQPELFDDARFASMEARYQHRRELDAIIGAWTAVRRPQWVMERLQGVGVPAGAVMHEPDVLNSPQHIARGFFQTIDSPETGRQRYAGRAWHASKTPSRAQPHPPLLGEHNAYVYRELLGFTEEQYRHFEELGHIGMDYDLARGG
jgi:crotonobetainyl-CoA:carnitine CoA-transferase CaiB-like acyl-CoA transferase